MIIKISEGKFRNILKTFISFLAKNQDECDETVENIMLVVKIHSDETADAIGKIHG